MKTTTTNLDHFHALLFEIVRKVRAEALNLLETVDDLIKTLNDTSITEDDTRLRIQNALKIGKTFISEHEEEVKRYFEMINTELVQHPELNIQSDEDVTTDITTMQNAWEKALLNWPDSTQENLPAKPELLFRLSEVQQAIYSLSVTAQILTFPDLVNQKLLDMHTGEKLDFFHEFSDEFYKPEFLPVAWQYLREHPYRIKGFLTDNGIIYRASPAMPHMLSSFLICSVVALGFLFIWLASILHYFPLPSLDALFRGYIALMVGGLVHTFVDVWKQYHTQPDHTANVLENWVLWVHVKQMNILYGILTLWTGLIILIVLQQVDDAGAAFFAGYSIDSFVGLFLVRFADTATQNAGKWGTQNLPKSTRQQVADVLAQSPVSNLPPAA